MRYVVRGLFLSTNIEWSFVVLGDVFIVHSPNTSNSAWECSSRMNMTFSNHEVSGKTRLQCLHIATSQDARSLRAYLSLYLHPKNGRIRKSITSSSPRWHPWTVLCSTCHPFHPEYRFSRHKCGGWIVCNVLPWEMLSPLGSIGIFGVQLEQWSPEYSGKTCV